MVEKKDPFFGFRDPFVDFSRKTDPSFQPKTRPIGFKPPSLRQPPGEISGTLTFEQEQFRQQQEAARLESIAQDKRISQEKSVSIMDEPPKQQTAEPEGAVVFFEPEQLEQFTPTQRKIAEGIGKPTGEKLGFVPLRKREALTFTEQRQLRFSERKQEAIEKRFERDIIEQEIFKEKVKSTRQFAKPRIASVIDGIPTVLLDTNQPEDVTKRNLELLELRALLESMKRTPTAFKNKIKDIQNRINEIKAEQRKFRARKEAESIFERGGLPTQLAGGAATLSFGQEKGFQLLGSLTPFQEKDAPTPLDIVTDFETDFLLDQKEFKKPESLATKFITSPTGLGILALGTGGAIGAVTGAAATTTAGAGFAAGTSVLPSAFTIGGLAIGGTLAAETGKQIIDLHESGKKQEARGLLIQTGASIGLGFLGFKAGEQAIRRSLFTKSQTPIRTKADQKLIDTTPESKTTLSKQEISVLKKSKIGGLLNQEDSLVLQRASVKAQLARQVETARLKLTPKQAKLARKLIKESTKISGKESKFVDDPIFQKAETIRTKFTKGSEKALGKSIKKQDITIFGSESIEPQLKPGLKLTVHDIDIGVPIKKLPLSKRIGKSIGLSFEAEGKAGGKTLSKVTRNLRDALEPFKKGKGKLGTKEVSREIFDIKPSSRLENFPFSQKQTISPRGFKLQRLGESAVRKSFGASQKKISKITGKAAFFRSEKEFPALDVIFKTLTDSPKKLTKLQKLTKQLQAETLSPEEIALLKGGKLIKSIGGKPPVLSGDKGLEVLKTVSRKTTSVSKDKGFDLIFDVQFEKSIIPSAIPKSSIPSSPLPSAFGGARFSSSIFGRAPSSQIPISPSSRIPTTPSSTPSSAPSKTPSSFSSLLSSKPTSSSIFGKSSAPSSVVSQIPSVTPSTVPSATSSFPSSFPSSVPSGVPSSIITTQTQPPPTKKTGKLLLIPNGDKIKKGQGFNVLIKRRQQKIGKGKFKTKGFKKANKRPLTRAAALGLGAKITDTFVNRSFKLQPSSKKGIKDSKLEQQWQARRNKFRFQKRKNKVNRNVIIEKTGFAIDSRQEKESIPFESARQRKAGVFKKKKAPVFGRRLSF